MIILTGIVRHCVQDKYPGLVIGGGFGFQVLEFVESFGVPKLLT